LQGRVGNHSPYAASAIFRVRSAQLA